MTKLGPFIAGLVTVLSMVGCRDRHHGSRQFPTSGPSDPVPGISSAPLPALPSWASAYVGKRKSDFKTSSACEGSFDSVVVRHTGPSPGVEIEGWAWLTLEHAAPARIVFVGPDGSIIGAGVTDKNRPDVPKAVKTITTVKVGWHGSAQTTNEDLAAFAVLPAQELCLIGQKNVGNAWNNANG
jgi:hypothetical protein